MSSELRNLAARWRAIAGCLNREEFPFLDGQAHGTLLCADDLDRLLAAKPDLESEFVADDRFLGEFE